MILIKEPRTSIIHTNNQMKMMISKFKKLTKSIVILNPSKLKLRIWIKIVVSLSQSLKRRSCIVINQSLVLTR
jgi:hypothetical protein